MGVCSATQGLVSNESTTNLLRVEIGNTMVEIIYGHYRHQKAEYLVIIVQQDNLMNSQILNSCVASPRDTINRISGAKKIVQISSSPKGFAYKKVITCVLPNYNSISTQQYKQKFSLILSQIFSKGKEFAFVFNQTHQFHNVPNQILKSKQQRSNSTNKIKLLSQQTNICQLFRLQIQKALGCEWQNQSYKSTNIPKMQY